MGAQEMTMRPIRLSELAELGGMTVSGSDIEIVTAGAMNIRSSHPEGMLTFLAGEDWIGELERSGIAACVVHESLAGSLGDRPLLVTAHDPTEAFYALFLETVSSGMWQTLDSRQGDKLEIAPTAVIHEGVQIGDQCRIMDNAVVMPNTRIGDRVTIKPNATVGGDGFEVREIGGRRTMVPHSGGVSIGDDVQIGSQTCVDRGMFGSFTVIEKETRIDNLVHVGHSAWLGPRGIVAASTEMGAITAGEGFWLGPKCAVLQGIDLGERSYVGIGSVVVRSVPPHALAYGNPAKHHGWVCACRTKLERTEAALRCRRCGRQYAEEGGALRETAAPRA